MSGRQQPSSSKRASAHPTEAPVVIGAFQRLDEIGKGSFALVYKGRHVKKGTYVAIKSVQMFRLSKKLKENLLSEINILRNVHHPHVVSLIDCQETPQYMHLVMEFCELGDLSHFIKKRNQIGNHPALEDMMRRYPLPAVGGLNEVVARHFLKQIASALEFLRAKNYVHRDIKPQNLLLVPPPKWYDSCANERRPFTVSDSSLVPAVGLDSLPMLKVADFGFARVLPQTSLAETLCGSPLYMAPEILRYEKYDAKADLWSVGTVLHEMMVGKPPFRASNHVELLRKIEQGQDKIKFPEGIIISTGMKHLIRSLLKKSPIERMGYESFFSHPVVREEIPGLAMEDRPVDPAASGGSLRRPQPTQSYHQPQQQPSPQSINQAATPITPDSSSPRDRLLGGNTPPSRPQTQPPMTTARRPSVRERNTDDPRGTQRPPIAPHATAPARPQAVGALAMGRRASHGRTASSPSTSMLRERLERERNIPPRRDDRALQEAREQQAAQDVAFERDYVLVEKKAVEVNAFADEMEASPHVRRYDRPTSPRDGIVARRATTSGTPSSLPNNATTRAISIANGRRTDAQHQRTGSYEQRRFGSIPNSATSAISKALNMANVRLFGMGFSPPTGKGVSPPSYGAFPAYPSAPKGTLLIDNGDKGTDLLIDDDQRTIDRVSDLAYRADVVYGFAEVKYRQLVPTTPSNDQGLGIGLAERMMRGPGDGGLDDDLTVDAIVAVAEEGLVLFVKALGILALTIDIAGNWWSSKQRAAEAAASGGGNSSSAPTTGAAGVIALASGRSQSPRALPGGSSMNSVVQYCRARFNECLEKSEFVRRKLIDAQHRLPLDHPGHPANHPDAAAGSASTATTASTSVENFFLSSGVTAERLMYERAIEMSRAAAVNELTMTDLPGCERSYVTAIHLLEAVLTTEDDSPSATVRKNGLRGGRHGGGGGGGAAAAAAAAAAAEEMMMMQPVNGLETEDRQKIVTLIESMKRRLKDVRSKIANQNANVNHARKRSSVSGPSRLSPSATPPR